MKLFNFFKTRREEPFSIKKKILILKNYIPEFYHSQKQYKNFIEFYENNEYQLSLESLVELCDENNHFFSNEYWSIIKEVAEKIEIKSIVKYCENQIERNKREINWKLPLGYTTNKIDERHYETFTSKINTDDWNDKRRITHKVADLKHQNGIHNKSRGRSGHLYYVHNEKITEIEYELGSEGLIIYLRNTKSWFYPNEIELSSEEKKIVKEQIIDWSKKTKNAIVFE